MYYERVTPEGEVVKGHRKPWARERLQTVVEGETMTTQSPFEEADINNIVAKFDRTGYLPPNTKEAQYADVTGLQGDLTENLEKANIAIAEAEKLTKAAERAKAAKEQEAKKKADSPPKEQPTKQTSDSDKTPD